MTPWLWLFAGPAVAAGIARACREWTRMQAGRADKTLALPPATVIVAIDGTCEGLRATLASLAAQDYPDYELVVAAKTGADIPGGALPSGVKVAVGRPEADGLSARAQNLMAGVRAARKRSQIVAFADAGGVARRGWLRALAAALAQPGTEAAAAVRHGRWLPAWRAEAFGPGGSIAVRKETFFDLKAPEFWKKAASEGYALEAAVRRAGKRVAFAPGAITRASGPPTWRDFLHTVSLGRQYYPLRWWLALGFHALLAAGLGAGIAALAKGRAAEGAAAIGALLAAAGLTSVIRAHAARTG